MSDWLTSIEAADVLSCERSNIAAFTDQGFFGVRHRYTQMGKQRFLDFWRDDILLARSIRQASGVRIPTAFKIVGAANAGRLRVEVAPP